MCEFVSWIETEGKGKKTVFFLTGEQIFHTKRGKELRDYVKYPDDYIGHGAIRWFYDLKENIGTNKECTNFSTPDNFPPDIVEAIKDDKMRGLGIAEKLLTPAAWAEYTKVTQPAWAEYKKVTQPAWAEYKKVTQPAAWAESEYTKVTQPAWAEYTKVEQPALAEYKKVTRDTFWDLFKVNKNRNPQWR